MVELLLSRGAHTNRANHEGVTPLMLSCREGYEDVVMRLLEEEGVRKNVDSRGR